MRTSLLAGTPSSDGAGDILSKLVESAAAMAEAGHSMWCLSPMALHYLLHSERTRKELGRDFRILDLRDLHAPAYYV